MRSDPSVVSNSDGRLEVFGRGTDWALDHIYQTTPNGAWSGLGPDLGGGITSAPTVIPNSSGNLQAFAVAESGNVVDDTFGSGGWSWDSLGGTLASKAAPHGTPTGGSKSSRSASAATRSTSGRPAQAVPGAPWAKL